MELVAARRAQAVGDPARGQVGNQRPQRGLIRTVVAHGDCVVAQQALGPGPATGGVVHRVLSHARLDPVHALDLPGQVAAALQRAHVG